jgi:signal transduction histidine kinase
MFSMRERAAELGGTFAIHSVPGSGVHITVHLPCEVSSDEI